MPELNETSAAVTATSKSYAHYRKRPVEVEAARFLPAEWDNGPELAAWCHGVFDWMPDNDTCWIHIDTLEGRMTAMPGDWIIKGVKGEFYPCKPDIFAATYEAVEPTPEESRVMRGQEDLDGADWS